VLELTKSYNTQFLQWGFCRAFYRKLIPVCASKMNAETVIHRFFDLLNQQKWKEPSRLLSATLSYNDASMPSETYMQLLQKETQSSSIVSWKLDALVHDRRSSKIGARIILSARTAANEIEATTPAPAGPLIEYPQHLIFVFQNGKISEIRAITDTDIMDKQVEHIDPSPRPLGPKPEHQPCLDLAQFYTSYVQCINDRTMETELHKYCHPHVTWCGRRLSIDEYRGLMEDSFEAISGLVFSVRDLIVDEERQQICSRIEFTGTPVRSYAGAEPNGRPVRFAEHAIYWLTSGKISSVVTVIDWKSYREQLTS